MNYTVINNLQSALDSSLYIVEIKLGTESDDPSQKYHWLIIDTDEQSITKLDFVSMKSSRDVEKRVFKQGELEYNNTIGTFDSGNYRAFYVVFPNQYVTNDVRDLVNEYVSSL